MIRIGSDIPDIKKSKTAICCSVGWLVNEDDKVQLVVMADFSFEDNGEIKQGGNIQPYQPKIY